MPGLMTLRPLTSASKASRGSSSESMNSSKTEKAWDERVPPSALSQLRIARMLSLNSPSAFRPSQLQACAQAVRPKQDLLAEKSKARLGGSGLDADRVDTNYCSSGSEHEPNSVCLAAMVNEFMEDEADLGRCGRARCNCETSTCNGGGCSSNDEEDSKSSFGGEFSEILQGLTPCFGFVEKNLWAEVSQALNSVKDVTVIGKDDGLNACIRRSVMTHLRAAGYNAAICKSRWDHAGGFPGGDYEYIDIILDALNNKSERVIVDTDFRAQFEIARPTHQYNAVVQVLPTVFVGKPERLQQIVSVMSEAVKLSLKNRGMHLPPWRKPEYLRAKWFSSYKRTTNEAFQHKQSDESSARDIARIAVRGTGWDSRYTSEMEEQYQKADSRQVMREMKNGMEAARLGKGSGQKVEEGEVEGVVSGAYRSRSFKSEVVPEVAMPLDNNAWQPPEVKPRTSQRSSAGTGLGTILREAGLRREAGLSALHRQLRAEQEQQQKLALAM